MSKGKIDILFDGMAGSCGKGKIAGYLALKENYDFSINNFMTNAGHTWISDDSEKVMVQHLSQSVVDGKSTIYISAGAAITPEVLLAEIERYSHYNVKNRLKIHPRAMVIEERHRESEAISLKRIGSTTKGCGHALADKVMRNQNVCLAKDHPVLNKYVDHNMTKNIIARLKKGERGLLEIPQGFDLDINHGLQYPHCTSRQTIPLQGLADAGIPHTYIGEIICVIRPYPIRVGNIEENGKQVGYSGDYQGSEEITWEEVEQLAGAPKGYFSKNEMTTVTGRLRRVFKPNYVRLEQMVDTCAPTQIALNFAQYIDIGAENVKNFSSLPNKVKETISTLEDKLGIPVTLVGTGATNSAIVDRRM